METMESLNRRVHTAEDLHSLVRTMKAMAAVNIRQLENAVESLAVYRRTIELGLQVVLRQQGLWGVRTRTAPRERLGSIVIGSDQGMCGQLNDQIVAEAVADARRNRGTRGVTLAIGGRVASRLADAGEPLEAGLPNASSTAGINSLVHDILLKVERWRTEQSVDRIVVYFCEHISRSSYQPHRHEILPMDRRWLQRLQQTAWPTKVLPTFTIDPDLLFSALVRQYLFVSLYRACAESLASENASRLAAMRGAERNIGEKIDELRSHFNQMRQMAITEELLDIASGFEALNVQD